jgi:hypothetical protein
MNQNERISTLARQQSTLKKQDFDYATLETETRIFVQNYTDEIKSLIRRSAQDIIEIGKKLSEVKQQLGHGNFRNWLKSEFNWSLSTAARFMQVSEQFKNVNLMYLQIATSALYSLAAPSTPEEARIEALRRAALGEVITHTSAKDLINQHKKASKIKPPHSFSSDVTSENAKLELVTSNLILDEIETAKIQTSAEIKRTSVVEAFADNIPITKIEESGQFESSNHSNYQPKDQTEFKEELLFEVGHHLCITDVKQQTHKWLGEIAEVKKSGLTDIEVVVKIIFQ